MARGLRIGLFFLLGLVPIGLVANRWLPEIPLPHVVREKLAYWTEHGDEYDVLFLGSSRIKNHLIPSQFDRALNDRGIQLRSFNFGISAMHAPENGYLLDLILAQSHAHLRWVFIEIDFIDGSPQEDEKGTLRGVYWHDPERLKLVSNCLWCSRGLSFSQRFHDAKGRLNDFSGHALLFAQRAVCLGRGAGALLAWQFHFPPQPLDPQALGPGGDGWAPAQEKKADVQDRASGALRKEVASFLKTPPQPDEGDWSSQTALATLASKIVAAGATPVFVIPPRMCRSYFVPSADLRRRFPTINLCDAVSYPELYQEAVRVDSSHLNAKGAEAITRIVSARFGEILAASPRR